MAAAACVLSVSARTLWTGNCTFAGYQVASGERPVFTPEDFNDAVVGDKIIFNITNNTADTESWHQVELWQYDGEKPGPNALGLGVHVLDGMTTAEFTIDETLLEGLRGGMTCAAGTGYTVRSIDITTFDGVIWEGECNCPEWVPNPAVTLPGSKFAVAQEGDALVFSVQKLVDGEYAAIQIDQATTFSAGPFGTKEIADGQTEVRITLTADLLANLVTEGINITGMNFKLTKIMLVAGGEEPPIVDDAIWSGTLEAGNWTNFITIPADKFATIQAGNVLAFTVTLGNTDSSICLKQNLETGWQEMPSDAGEYGNYIYIENGPGIYYFPVNAAAAASMKAHGLAVAGSGYTLTKITLEEAPVEQSSIWSGTMTAGDWENQLTIEASKLADVTEGTILSFTVSNVEGNGSISLKQNLPEGWGEMPSDDGEFGNYLNLSEGPGTYYFTVNAAAAASMKQYGMVVAGLGYTLTEVAYVEGTGIVNASVAKTASAVYNLNGVKVADSLDAVSAPGFYISGGKKIIIK